MKILKRNFDKRKIRKSFRNVVWFYDIWSHLTESKAAEKAIELADIEDGRKILEVACGTGIVFEQIVNKNPNGLNIGVDLSPEMLSKARKRLNKRHGNFELQEGDALQLSFQENAFDIVVNNFMVDLLPVEAFDQVAEEFHRVLKPNGIVVISTFSFGKKKINKIWYWIAKYFPDLLTGCRPVSFRENLMKTGFTITEETEISQNTFPSKVVKAKKGN